MSSLSCSFFILNKLDKYFIFALNKKSFMKKLVPLFILLIVFSCKKNSTETTTSEQKNYDSINAAITKYNDSIKILNNQNQFADLSGSHKLSFSNDEGVSLNGKVEMKKKGRDHYDISGDAKNGNNTLKINGTIKRVSEKHLNFEGEISQTISGKVYKRNKPSTFYDEGKGKFWRLQDKVNSDGFVDYIDIAF